MTLLLAIDPGPEQSALVLYDTESRALVKWEKSANSSCWPTWAWRAQTLAVEIVASYGMAVGQSVFTTCVWTGRFIERWYHQNESHPVQVTRKQVAVHVCGSARANDSNIRAALVDRYGGSDRAAKGTKAQPGPLHGLAGDGWAAFAVAITAAEKDA